MVLSIVVITYNQESYIRQTLDSILQQKHSYSMEIVIGDDLSSDNTRDILKEYHQKYPGIIKLLLNEKNLGLVNNYFNVIAHCSGEYIMVCAGDDWWHSDKISLQIEFIKKNPEYGMVYTKAQMFSQAKGRLLKQCWGGICENFHQIIYNIGLIPPMTMCFRRELVNQYVKEINPCVRDWKMEDYPFYIWLILKSRIYFMDIITATYRVLPESAAHSTRIDKQEAFNKSVNDVRLFYVNYCGIDYCAIDLNHLLLYDLLINAIVMNDRRKVLNYYNRIDKLRFKDIIGKLCCRTLLSFQLLRVYVKWKMS